jgi:nitrogen fixation protein NifQ
MAHARGLPNDDALACMLATWCTGGGSLPADLGLETQDYHAMLERHFPHARLTQPPVEVMDPERHPERDELRHLLFVHLAGEEMSERWIADIVVAACMAGNHLWQDLGLWSRQDLSTLMTRNFPALAAKNDRDMKWKKFLYKQLCIQEGIYTCRAPSCEVCVDYQACFGPEE